MLADVVGADRELAMASVDQNRQAHDARAAEVEQRVERGPDRTAGVEDVVDQYHREAVHIGRHCGSFHRARPLERDIVAIERDVERARGHGHALERGDGVRQSLGQRRAPGPDPHQAEILGALVVLDYLVSDPGERPPDLVRLHDVGRAGWCGRLCVVVGEAPAHQKTLPDDDQAREARACRAIIVLLSGLTGPS